MPDPSFADVSRAIARAVQHRRDLARQHPDNQQTAPVSVDAGIVGVPLRPHRARGDWWIVGYVLDSTSGATDEYAVWLLPGAAPEPQPRRDAAATPRGHAADIARGSALDG